MKLALVVVPVALLAACGGKSNPAVGNSGASTAHIIDDVDGDGKADTAALEGNAVVLVGTAVRATLPSNLSWTPSSAQVVELGTEAVIAVASEVLEDDLAWRIYQYRDGALVDLGEVFLGNGLAPEDLPGDGTIHTRSGNCGVSTSTVYRVMDGKIERSATSEGTHDDSQCAACPYVAVDTTAGAVFVGESLRNLAGAHRATEDALTLPALAPGQRELVVHLFETKPETTYLDGLAVDFGGVRVAPRACGAVCTADGAAEVFALGERRRFVFDVPAGFTGAPVLYAHGYYQPFAPMVAR